MYLVHLILEYAESGSTATVYILTHVLTLIVILQVVVVVAVTVGVAMGANMIVTSVEQVALFL